MKNKNKSLKNNEEKKMLDEHKDELTEVENDASLPSNEVLQEIENLKKQTEVLEDKLLRTSAEAENIRKRYEKIAQEAREYANTNFAKDLLGVMDNLVRALGYKPEEADSQVTNIISGIEMTKNELASIFNKYGIQVIEPAFGEKFDYNFHHAVSQIVTDEYNEDSIVDTMQVGYKIKDRLLRPAMVKVSKKSN